MVSKQNASRAFANVNIFREIQILPVVYGGAGQYENENNSCMFSTLFDGECQIPAVCPKHKSLGKLSKTHPVVHFDVSRVGFSCAATEKFIECPGIDLRYVG